MPTGDPAEKPAAQSSAAETADAGADAHLQRWPRKRFAHVEWTPEVGPLCKQAYTVNSVAEHLLT